MFFPRSTLNQRMDNVYNAATGVFPTGDTLRVGVAEDYMSDYVPVIHYDLTADLELIEINPSDLFEQVHDRLYREEDDVDLTVEEELERLRREGVEVVKPRRDTRPDR